MPILSLDGVYRNFQEFIDAGRIIDIKSFPISQDNTAEDIFNRCEDAIFSIFCNWLDKLCNSNFQYIQLGNNWKPIYYRKSLDQAKDLTHIVRAFTFKEKESAYYFTQDGRKVILDYVDGPSIK
jgi:methionyl-tRNA formyltransferase